MSACTVYDICIYRDLPGLLCRATVHVFRFRINSAARLWTDCSTRERREHCFATLEEVGFLVYYRFAPVQNESRKAVRLDWEGFVCVPKEKCARLSVNNHFDLMI